MTPEPELLSVTEFAKRLGLKRTSAYKLIANEPGVVRYVTPGSTKAIVRVPAAIADRILRRSTIPA